jgi:hypothetical protein
MNENQKQGGKAAAQDRQMADTAQQAAQEGTRRIKEITNEAAEAGQQAVTATAEAVRVGENQSSVLPERGRLVFI